MIVAYATPGPYKKMAKKLRRSLTNLGIPHEIDILPCAGSWAANAHLRASYLLDKIKHHDNILSIDVDVEVLSDPLPYLKTLKCHLAAHYIKLRRGPRGKKKNVHELLPGTLWLCNSKPIKRMLELWLQKVTTSPEKADRWCCRWAVKNTKGLKIAKLPPSYAYIFDTSKKLYPKAIPIIKHMQASRKHKK